ncbi:MAG: hypothetical protein FWD71_19450 [Oscillospiraceae bacterium]|nr:hypothetical protein [Oscillospiraceae bacterium]
MPAYVIIIAVVVIVIIVNVIRISIKSSDHHFECPNCGEHFQADFFKSFFTAHSLGGQYSMKCPKCGKTNMMASISGKK